MSKRRRGNMMGKWGINRSQRVRMRAIQVDQKRDMEGDK